MATPILKELAASLSEIVKTMIKGVKLSQVKLSDNLTLIQFEGDTLEKDAQVFSLDSANNKIVLADGIYSYAVDNKPVHFKIENGLVSQVSDKEIQLSTEIAKAAAPADTTPEPDAADDKEDADEDAIEDQKMIDDSIQKALAPILADIATIKDTLGLTSDMSKQLKDVQQALSKVTEVVNILADSPNGEPIKTEQTFTSNKTKFDHPAMKYFADNK